MITHNPLLATSPTRNGSSSRAHTLCLLPEDAGQRVHNLRDVFDAARWLVRSGSPWRYLPKDFPPWEMVYQQTRRWLAAGCFEAIVHDLPRLCSVRRRPQPRAVGGDLRQPHAPGRASRAGRAGYDGHKRTQGSEGAHGR